MKVKTVVSALFAITLLSFSSIAISDDNQKASKYENADWYTVRFIQFKDGKQWAAQQFIKQHFIPVDVELKRNVSGYRFEFGQWDQMVFFPMDGGPSDLEWKQTPMNIKWWNLFVKRAGGEKEAAKLMDEWSSLVAKSETALVRSLD